MFALCSSLTKVKLAAHQTISMYFCYRCGSLADINLDAASPYIADGAFQYSDLSNATITYGCGSYAFAFCTKLYEVTVSSVLHTVGTNAFFGDSNLFMVRDHTNYTLKSVATPALSLIKTSCNNTCSSIQSYESLSSQISASHLNGKSCHRNIFQRVVAYSVLWVKILLNICVYFS